MERIFLSGITIENVRHLRQIAIPLSKRKAKHLIFTGKNGSGKTSVLVAMSKCLDSILWKGAVKNGLHLEFSQPEETLGYQYQKGEFIVAFYRAERVFQADVPQHVEKVALQDYYQIADTPRRLFVKYLLDMEVTEALARNKGNHEKADKIREWFTKFRNLLRRIFDDDSLELIFDEDKFTFFIRENGRETFDFNTMSSGFAAVLDIVLDLIVRMEKTTRRSFDFHVPGIVLIDEVETHLHLEMQRNVLGLLTTIFPNVQFVVSTHSPFVLNSLEDAVIYDLENRIVVENGLADVPYSGIVEGYFNASGLSALLAEKFEAYRKLVKKQDLSDDDFEEAARLEMFLNEIPDYLALDITTEYQRLKIEFEGREDI